MKVIYEFFPDDLENSDKHELKLVQKATSFYLTLSDIQEYLRKLDKEWIEDDREKIIETIRSFIGESGIYEVEE